MDYVLPAFAGVIALASVLLSPRAESESAFYQGVSATGQKPGLLALTFSQVTTWIFARRDGRSGFLMGENMTSLWWSDESE